MTTSTSRRWCTIGHSSLSGAAEATRRAAHQALSGRTPSDDDPALVIVFATAAHDLTTVAEVLRELLPPATRLAGCTTAGEITAEGSHNATVALMMLGGNGFAIDLAYAQGLSADSAGTGQAVAEHLFPLAPEASETAESAAPEDADARAHEIVILLSDGLSGDQQAMVTGVYRVTGAAIRLVGGCAGDDLAMQSTTQLVSTPQGDLVLTDSVVGVRLRSDAPLGVGVRHGWTRTGEALVVTGSSGPTVHTLDDEPALDAYLRAINAPAEVRESPAAFTRFALHHPLGIPGRGHDLVRFVTGADFETRCLNLVAPVPQGGLTWIMEGGTHEVLDASGEACRIAVEQLDGQPAKGVIAFDCIARRAALGEAVTDEVDEIVRHTDAAPMIGFYTYGEIARTHGLNGFHNQTLVVLAFA
ncbi:MAG: FIST C-terminal domain-containing protein [Kineosporiaceae bacterium]|nr:FIST C-terminal domain-containing protein [Kineosporiaceae bacterium]MBK8076179.1 FIST C-terminal domain-containing protein [Kineosporiaceae bacterium]